MPRTLRRTVTVDGKAYPAGESPPAAIARRITNPRMWEAETEPAEEPPAPEPLTADSAGDDVVGRNADVVIAFVQDHPVRAKELLELETASKDRQTVKDALTKAIEAQGTGD